MGLFVIDIAWPSGGFVALICCHCGGFMVVYGGIIVVCGGLWWDCSGFLIVCVCFFFFDKTL